MASRIRLQQTFHTVTIQCSIVSDKGDVLREGLSDEHAVEWIFMRTWKQSCANAVLDGHGDHVELLSCQVKHEILDDFGGNIELTQANLRGHFPRRSSTYGECILSASQKTLGRYWQQRTLCQPPKQSMGVQ